MDADGVTGSARQSGGKGWGRQRTLRNGCRSTVQERPSQTTETPQSSFGGIGVGEKNNTGPNCSVPLPYPCDGQALPVQVQGRRGGLRAGLDSQGNQEGG